MKTLLYVANLLCVLSLLPADAAPRVQHKAWTDSETALREDTDFAIQGEYGSAGAGVGVQVVALGKGMFDAHVLDGGLPGLGWVPGKPRDAMTGRRDGDRVVFTGMGISATISGEFLSLRRSGDREIVLPRSERTSPTLGAQPPEDAIVLFDGTSTDEWENGKMENGLLLATNSTSKRHFADYKLHLEFRTPYMPDARGQRRGNSGVYYGGRWETQILDSFGLDAGPGDCGGIYSIARPRLNMCLPPLAWQTYDVEFTAAKFDDTGNRTAWPRITVRLNGVLVHEDLELSKDFTPAAPITSPLTSPEGPVFLQDHNDEVIFRNIWIVPGE